MSRISQGASGGVSNIHLNHLPLQIPSNQIMDREGQTFKSVNVEMKSYEDDSSGLRLRKLSQQEFVAPQTQPHGKAFANPAQAKSITKAKANYNMASKYIVEECGAMSDGAIDSCDPSYCCGRQRFYNTEGDLLDQTGCCHCTKACFACRGWNSAELGIFCGPTICLACCISALNRAMKRP